jgi:tRNA 2-(methylsulfanyl)-N6-isopentenyladenosine37 hydroxylase
VFDGIITLWEWSDLPLPQNYALPLLSVTPEAWLVPVLENFDRFLMDHAACERKAAALAMSYVSKYMDRRGIVEAMIALAREELEHFHQVYRLLANRGLPMGVDEKDEYVNLLLRSVRHGKDEALLDKLLVAAAIEARGCERFSIIGNGHPEPELAQFYLRLAHSEAAHYRVFLRLAETYFPEDIVQAAFHRILLAEAEAIAAVPFRPALH